MYLILCSIGEIKCFWIIKAYKNGYLEKMVKKTEKVHIFLTNWGKKVSVEENVFTSPYPQIRRVGKLISNDSTIIPYSFCIETS